LLLADALLLLLLLLLLDLLPGALLLLLLELLLGALLLFLQGALLSLLLRVRALLQVPGAWLIVWRRWLRCALCIRLWGLLRLGTGRVRFFRRRRSARVRSRTGAIRP
jgi:hypothetical protein